MLYTLKIRLYPSPEQTEQLLKTMERFNSACNVISHIAFKSKIFSKVKLQHICYYQIRDDFKLSAQMVVRAIGKVAESYSDKNKRDNLHIFKPHGAIVYDDRILTVKSIDTVSILTLDGKFYSGAKVKNLRKRNFKMRQKLQAKGTKSAKRLLKRRRRKESRFATDVNHCISKRLVEVAKGTQRAIVLEDLKGIRKRERKGTRKTVCKTMRQALSNWSFYQLRRFIE